MNSQFYSFFLFPWWLHVSTISDSVAKASLGVTVTMNITNIGTQGYPGTGKTSILDLAMGKEPAPQRNSTGCIDPPSRYMLINSEGGAQLEWENVTTDMLTVRNMHVWAIVYVITLYTICCYLYVYSRIVFCVGLTIDQCLTHTITQ